MDKADYELLFWLHTRQECNHNVCPMCKTAKQNGTFKIPYKNIAPPANEWGSDPNGSRF